MKIFTKTIMPFCIVLLTGMISLNVNAQNNTLDFDGINDYVEVPFSSTIAQTASLEVWANADANNGQYQSVITNRGNFRGYSFYAAPDNTWQLWVGDGTPGWKIIHGPAISYGTWTHLAATYDGITLRFYVNGAPAGSLAVTIAANTTFPLRIGAGQTETPTPNFYFGGQIDEARFWSSFLSNADILANMNKALTGTEPGLLAYYNFNEGIANGDNTTPPVDTLKDLTVNQVTGKLFNFALIGTASNWVGSSVVLPINLLSFSGSKKDGSNLLQWSTASEQNSSYFEVQRSENGTDFKSIAKVTASGNSNNLRNYQYSDKQVSSVAPTFYYRLKLVDIDGSFKFSSVLFIKNSIAGLTTIYPNPATSKITINVTDKNLINTSASLNDINGKKIQAITITQSTTEVNISNYTKGIYIVKFEDGKSIKFIKE